MIFMIQLSAFIARVSAAPQPRSSMAVTAWRSRQIRNLSDNTSLQAGSAGDGTYLDLIFTAVPPLSEEFARTGATAARGARCGAAVRAGRLARWGWVTPLPPIVTTRIATLSKT